jgi:hypothetical protein
MTAEDIMRTTIYLGTIALGLAFGAANAIAGNLGSDSLLMHVDAHLAGSKGESAGG